MIIRPYNLHVKSKVCPLLVAHVKSKACPLLVANHGKLWKSLMRAHLGDYECMEEKLNTNASVERRQTLRFSFMSTQSMYLIRL